MVCLSHLALLTSTTLIILLWSTCLSLFIPVDTWRKLNIHKMFRRRPGRLLNVLCTFSLRHVSTGMRIYFWLNYNFILKVCTSEIFHHCFYQNFAQSAVLIGFSLLFPFLCVGLGDLSALFLLMPNTKNSS